MKNICVYIFGVCSLFAVMVVHAQEVTPCTPISCGDLGYTKTIDDCSEGVKCPFDTSKIFCLEKCEVGSILYSNKSCSKVVRTDKTPIAIVFDTTKKLAMALEQAYLQWGPKIDIPTLTDCISEPELCDVDGKVNTTVIITYGKENSINYPAAEYCSKYTTVGTTAGNWYLPSFAELKSIHDAKSDVNSGLNKLGKPTLTEHYYWPSLEKSSDGSWIFIMDGGYYGGNLKTNKNYVRPIMVY